jgi:predicted nucleic acid-binding protein
MIVYALVVEGQVVAERVRPAPLDAAKIRHVEGLPVLRPIVEDLGVPAGHRATGTAYVVGDEEVTRVYTTEAIPLAEQRETKLERARAEGAGRLDQLAHDYTPQERDTWAQQAREADAYAASSSDADAPLLAAMAAARGIATQAMVDKVNLARGAFTLAGGAILGAQQALEDAIRAAADQAALDAIDPSDAAHWPAGGS